MTREITNKDKIIVELLDEIVEYIDNRVKQCYKESSSYSTPIAWSEMSSMKDKVKFLKEG